MKSRFFLVVSIVLFTLSCNQFVNLGDENKKSSADNTEGLPDELYENDSADAGSEADYGDWNEDSADSEYYGDYGEGAADEADSGNNNDSYDDEMQDADVGDYNCNDDTDSESEGTNEFPDENASNYIFPESDPFPEGFSNAECDCGENPQYDPVCCNGVILVFNSCFAHCYAIRSGNKICSVYHTGLCTGYEESDDDPEEISENDTEENDQDLEIIDDNDEDELPGQDEDSEVSGSECGCYPEEEAAIFSCGEHSYLITSCLAHCLCEDPEQLFI